MSKAPKRSTHVLHRSSKLSPNARALRETLERRFGPYGEDAMEVLGHILHGTLEAVEERLDKNGNVVQLIHRPTISERHAAAELTLAYINGRPAARVQVTAEEDDPAEMTDGALEAKVVEVLTEVAKRRNQLPEKGERPVATLEDAADSDEIEAEFESNDSDGSSEDGTLISSDSSQGDESDSE